MASSTSVTTVYDYNVYIDGGKPAIVQINLKEGQLYLYQQGVIKRSHSLLLLLKFTSAHLTLKLDFLEGDLEIELENLTEKAAFFELLSLVFDTQADDSVTGVKTPVKTGDLKKERKVKSSITWNSRHVKLYSGYFTLYLPGEESPEIVVELWTDTCKVDKLEDSSLSVSASGQSYSFRLCGEDQSGDRVEEWIQEFNDARRQPRKLTEEDIAAAVLGLDDEDQMDCPSEPQDEDEVDALLPLGDETDGDVECQAAMFTGSWILPWTRNRMKKRARKPTEEEEFVIIELKDVLQCRAELTEEHLSEENREIKAAPQEPVNDGEDQSVNTSVETTADEHNDEKVAEEAGQRPSSPKPSPPPPPGPPPPPPPPPPSSSAGPQQERNGIKLKEVPTCMLKQAHWAKVSSARIENSLWNKLEDESGNLQLKDLEKQFFVKENTRAIIPNRSSSDVADKGGKVLLDHKRVQILGIVFKRPYDRVLDRLKDAMTSTTEIDVFNVEKLREMRKLVPTAEDREMYKKHRREKLVPVDRFMKDLCEIKELGLRLDLTINVITFPRRLQDCRERISDLTKACREVSTSELFRRVLSILLAIGNYLNANRAGGYGIRGFQITSVDKILDIKNTDTGFTVLNYLVQQLQSSDQKLIKWTNSLQHVPICSEVCVNAVQADVNGLKAELKKRRDDSIKIEKSAWNRTERDYCTDVQTFLSLQEVEVASLGEMYSSLKTTYTDMLEYLGEPADRKSGDVFSAIADFMRKFDKARDHPRT